LWEYSDVIIVVGALVEVGLSGEGVCFVGRSRLVNKLEVVVCQFREVVGYMSVDTLWVVVVLEIFVVGEDDNGVGSLLGGVASYLNRKLLLGVLCHGCRNFVLLL